MEEVETLESVTKEFIEKTRAWTKQYHEAKETSRREFLIERIVDDLEEMENLRLSYRTLRDLDLITSDEALYNFGLVRDTLRKMKQIINENNLIDEVHIAEIMREL